MPDIKWSKTPVIWIQDTADNLNLVKQYRIIYKDEEANTTEEVGIVTDFNKGLIGIIKELNYMGIEVKEIE